MVADSPNRGGAGAGSRTKRDEAGPRAESGGWRSRLERIGLASLLTVVGLNVWTGSPLLALWVGSRVQGSGPPKMTAVFVVALVLAIVSLLLVRILAILGAAYDDLTGQAPTVRTHAPWLRSMRGERERYAEDEPRLTALERMLVVMVVAAIATFEVWFFFFSGSPIGQG